jgi:hypothetical protein
MKKDIILKALHRFQEIVLSDQAKTYAAHPSSEADVQLARLAIKKYQKTVALRLRIPRKQSNGNTAWE